MTEISYLLPSARNFFSRNDSFQHRGERPTDRFEWLNTACKGEGGKKTTSLLKNVWKGKKRLSPDSGLRVATAYLAKTSVIARNVGRRSCEACGQRDRPAEPWGSSILQPKHWRIRGRASPLVRRPFIFSFFFSFASWHDLNKWASGQFLSLLLSRRLNLWIFAAPMINRFQYDVGASISQTWVCVQGSGQRYCTADRKQPVVLRDRETFGYPQVADGAGCGGNLCGPAEDIRQIRLKPHL